MSLKIGDTAPEFHLQNANQNIGDAHASLAQSMKKNGCVVVFELSLIHI